MLFAATGPVVVGSLADLYSWAAAFGSLIILLAVVGLLLAVNHLFRLEY